MKTPTPRRAAALAMILCLGAAGCQRIVDRIRDETRDRDPPPATQTPPTNTPTNTPTNNNPNNNPQIQIPGLGQLPIPFPIGNPPGGTNNNGSPNAPVDYASIAPAPAGSYDNTGTMTQAFLRQETFQVFSELVQNLSAEDRAKIQGIPLRVAESPREVNAAAGCTRGRRAFMLITSALLTLSGAAAEAKAYDDLSGQRVQEQYYTNTATNVRRQQPVQGLGPGVIPMPLALDARKLARQRLLFDEQVGFVLGHELAHHYRGHTGCANGTPASDQEVTPEEVVRVLSNTVPLFNQPLELESDTWGVTNVLDAGSRRQGGRWNEEGALMSLDFFGHLTRLGVDTLLLGIMRTHPPPALRIPWVQAAANNWRNNIRPQAGTIPGLPIPIPLPQGFPIQLPAPPR
ncbi:MAG: M48 family metalloprotease [Deltaproteobacteria bacterium]|nr:M48 family metalloprotease [Deltaproteobacteria bacterium]